MRNWLLSLLLGSKQEEAPTGKEMVQAGLPQNMQRQRKHRLRRDLSCRPTKKDSLLRTCVQRSKVLLLRKDFGLQCKLSMA